MHPQQQAVQVGIVAGRTGDLVDLRELVIGQCAAGAGQPAWLGDPDGGGVGLREVAVIDGVLADAAQRRDHVLGGGPAPAGVAAYHHVGAYLFAQLPDLQRCRFV